ncbi:MAG TPA: hypothetical protein VI731_06205 [Bacteroidia bacterium]|nr:hypothetical protein [Bacteroidia bacterium]
MKILYVFADQTNSAGVFEKVEAKIRYLNKNGMECHGMFFRFDIPGYSHNKEKNIEYFPLKRPISSSLYKLPFLRSLHAFKRQDGIRKTLIEEISFQVSHKQFDLLLFRYPLASKWLYAFTEQYKNRFVFEHNANELFVAENRYRETNSGSAKYDYLAEKEYGAKCTANALGLVSVGYETMEFQLRRSGKERSSAIVIGNGADLSKIIVRTTPPLEEELRIIFLTGSPRPVDGIDLVLRGLKSYNGPRKVSFQIVGPVSKLYIDLVTELELAGKVTFRGLLHGEELDLVFNECHFAIGTMALFRKGLKEHSALKTLEYTARGIPYAIGYRETNLIGVSNADKYILQIDDPQERLSFDTLVEFAEGVLKNVNHPAEMRRIADEHMNIAVKMRELKDFILQLKT